jgi:hypothetical protein
LFAVTVFPGAEALGYYVYELSTGTDHGLIGWTRMSMFNSLGGDRVIREDNHKTDPHINGWYITDTFWTKERNAPGDSYPRNEPLTKILTDNHIHAINRIDAKLLHQGKRLLFAWSYISQPGPIQRVVVRWNENLDEVRIEPLVLQMRETETFFYQGPTHISGDGNWMKSIRVHQQTRPRMDELVAYHLQDYYPQGMSMPVSLGYTNEDPGAFLNHRTLGPCYIEQSLTREGILFIYRLDDALDIMKKQALSILPGAAE